MYKCYTSLAFLLLCSFFAQAQIDWVPLNGPRGISQMQVVACDSTGRLFARHSPGHLYISTDNGTTWADGTQGISSSDLSSISYIFVLPSGKTYARGYNALYRYDSSTQKWVFVPSNPFSPIITFDAAGRLWKVDGYANVWVSADEGQTFQAVLDQSQTDGWYEWLAPHNNEHNLLAVAFGTSGTLYHFTAGGTVKLVTAYNSGIEYLGYNPFSGTAFWSDYDGLRRSTDGGLTWKPVVEVPGEPIPSGISKIFYESAGRIWAEDHGAVYRSDDDGLTWTFVTAGYSFFRSPNGALFVSGSCYPYDFARSTDNGATWTDLSQQFSAPNVSEIVQDRSTGNLFVKECYDYERSTDSGINWERNLTVPDSTPTKISQLVTHPDGSIFAVGIHIYHSSDGGNHWTQTKDPKSPIHGLPKIATDHDGNLYAFYPYPNSYKSTDMGQTWKNIDFYISASHDSRAVVRSNGDVYVASFSSLIHYIASQDTTVYEEVAPGTFADVTDLHATLSDELYVSTLTHWGNDDGLYRLAANGQFERVPFFDTRNPNLIASNQHGVVFVTSQDTIYQSDNGGLMWTMAGKTPQKQPANYATVLYVGTDQHLYFGYYNDVVHRSTQPTAARNLVRGKVWLDKNGNCAQDPDEPGLTNLNIKATRSNGAFSGFSGSEGRYKVSVPDGAYALNVVPPNALFAPCLPDVPLNFTGTTDTASADLPLKKAADCPYLRVSVATPFLRRCFDNTYTVRYCNEGTAPATGAYMEVLLDSLFDFVSATLPVSAQSGQIYTFLLGDVQPGDCGQFYLKIKVSCEAALGQEHCMEAHIYPDQPCLPTLPALAVSRECRQNMGAFDPNDKRAFVAGREEPGSVLPNTDIEYIVRFQNTGTDTAFRVVIEDRFTSLLDLNSLRPLASSHPFELEVSELGLVRFVFDNIALPDSHINAAGSIGFVKFVVRQMPDLPLGSVIRNQASIFFDFNAPVITNESKLVVTIPVGTTEPDQPYRVSAYPNPFGEAVTCHFSSPDLPDEWGLRIFDALGRLVGNYRCGGRTFTVPRGQMGSGFYHYVISSGSGQRIWSGTLVAGDF